MLWDVHAAGEGLRIKMPKKIDREDQLRELRRKLQQFDNFVFRFVNRISRLRGPGDKIHAEWTVAEREMHRMIYEVRLLFQVFERELGARTAQVPTANALHGLDLSMKAVAARVFVLRCFSDLRAAGKLGRRK